MNDNNNGWPDPSRPGVPLHPERDSAHWIVGWNATLFVAEWVADTDAKFGGYFEWAGGDDYPMGMVENGWTYAGPCLTPAEVAQREAAAVAAERERAAEKVNALAPNVPTDAPLDYRQGWSAGLAHAEAAIRKGDKPHG